MKKERKTKVKLEDLAREAQVSKATVSLALNGSPRVAVDTVRRINELVEKYNYTPNSLARRLSKRTSETVSLFMMGRIHESSDWLVPSSWLFYNPIFKGISLTLSENNYQLSFEFIDLGSNKRIGNIINHAQSSSADGLLVLISDEFDYSFLEELASYLPIITLNKKLSEALSSVEVDNIKGAIDAVTYLANLGHERIAHIKGPEFAYNAVDRFTGYLEALGILGLETTDAYIHEGDWNIDSGKKNMERLLKLANPPTAVFCANDHMAIGAMEAILEAGLRVPEDISLVGFDDTEMSRITRPRLTTVCQPLEQLGRTAAREILRRIREQDLPPEKEHIVLSSSLVERESSRPIFRSETKL